MAVKPKKKTTRTPKTVNKVDDLTMYKALGTAQAKIEKAPFLKKMTKNSFAAKWELGDKKRSIYLKKAQGPGRIK